MLGILESGQVDGVKLAPQCTRGHPGPRFWCCFGKRLHLWGPERPRVRWGAGLTPSNGPFLGVPDIF